MDLLLRWEQRPHVRRSNTEESYPVTPIHDEIAIAAWPRPEQPPTMGTLPTRRIAVSSPETPPTMRISPSTPGPAPPPPDSPRSPRTPNRVRFDLPEHNDLEVNGLDGPPPYTDSPRSGRRHPRQSIPLLTDIEAPSVTLAASPWGNDDVHEWAERERLRPKSGLRSAFMNMANSIIGAGIIGQPYAFRQAGLLTGVILLIGLTVTVDWTIRLIVINSKLSGSNSFQGTVQHCFGKTGLIAISVAQWAFAFGGMIAFCIIVGDTIPHVMAAVFPGLGDIPVLGLLVNRKAVIVIFVMGVSYPLSLYRDIAKVSHAWLCSMDSTNTFSWQKQVPLL